VTGEIALTAVLLIGASLLTQSLRTILRAETGFDAENVMTMRVALSGQRYQSASAQLLFFQQLLPEVRALGWRS
jgi:hypothetical protein